MSMRGSSGEDGAKNHTLWSLSAAELAAGFRAGRFSPVEVAQAILKRIEQLDGTLNAFCFLDADAVLKQAKESAKRWGSGNVLGPLDGVPFSIKDNIFAADTPTLFGSAAVDRDSAFGPDSPSVARLREGGAVILGKTCLPEFAHKLVTDSPLTGITRNPWDTARSPGGSSGGAAAAVASGCGPIALGTDGGGSIRVPAAWSGIYGLKSSFGRVPHHPRGPFAILSHVGPMTRTTADAALVMSAITKPDVRDWYSLPPDSCDYLSELDRGTRGMRIAVSLRLGLSDVSVDPEIAAALDRAAAVFERLGAVVELADPPLVDRFNQVHGSMWIAFCARAAKSLEAKRHLLGRSFLELVEAGERLPGDAFLEALTARGELAQKTNEFFASFDVLLCPAFPGLAPAAEGTHDSSALLPKFTSWCNQTGLPAASIPICTSSTGLPIGLQLVAGRFADSLVLRASRAFEHERGPLPWPAIEA